METASQALAPAPERENSSDKERSSNTCRPRPAAKDGPPLFRNRVVRFREAAIHHHLCPNGVIRRYVVLESQALRQKLGKPRRCEIDPYVFKGPERELRTSDAWESVECDAIKSLRVLYAKVRELDAAEPVQPRSSQLPGRILPAHTHEGSARGVLLYAGPREGVAYCVDLLDHDTGQVRRIAGIDLARALDVSGARTGEHIRVVGSDSHSVTIREQREGSHGEGKTTFQRSRATFDIVRESMPTPETRARSA